MYKIGDFSRRSQIPVKTLRYYDEIELLKPAHVDGATGYRYYSPAQFERLNRILVLKDLGFSLAEIRALVEESVPVAQIRGMLRAKRDDLERAVADERARLARAEARLDVMEAYGEAAAREVAVRRVPSRMVAALRATVPSYDDVDALFEEIDHHLAAAGRAPGASTERGAVWHACGAKAAIDCEAVVFLPGPLAPGGRVRVYEMAAHTAATLVYRGDEDAPAYAAMRAWLGASDARDAGPKREVYLDAGRSGEASVVEIQWPILAESDAVH